MLMLYPPSFTVGAGSVICDKQKWDGGLRSSWSEHHGKQSEAEVLGAALDVWTWGDLTYFVEEFQGYMLQALGMTDTEEEEARKATDGSCSEATADGVSKRSCANEAGCHGLPLRALLGDLPSTPLRVVSFRGPPRAKAVGMRSQLLLTEQLQSKAVCCSLYRH